MTKSGLVDIGTVPGAYGGAPGQKVDDLGLREKVLTMLSENRGFREIHKRLNKYLKSKGEGNYIAINTIRAWWVAQAPTLKDEVTGRQMSIVIQEAWDWERQSIQERNKLKQALVNLIGEENMENPDHMQGLEPKEKRIAVDIINAHRTLLESGERFMGIGSQAGQRYGSTEVSKDELLERIKEVLAKPPKRADQVVKEATFHDIEEIKIARKSKDTRKVDTKVITDL